MLTSIRCHELVYAGDFDAVREAARQRFRSGDGRRAVVPLVDFWVGLSYLLDGRIALAIDQRSEEHTSELQSLMRSSYAVFCLKKNNTHTLNNKRSDNKQTI